ncbi:MAG: hypothetical protein AAFZ07_17870 [Actinomycetota bacterium]
MRGRALPLAVGLVLAACTGSSSTAAPDTTTPASASTAPAAGGDDVAPSTGGRIVAVRDDREIVVFDPDGGPERVVSDGAIGGVARQPVWSPDGTEVAWAALDDGDRSSVRWRRVDGGEVESVETPSLPFYLAHLDGGARLAWLGNAEGGVGLSLVDVATGTSQLVDVAVPYYLDAVDGGPLVAHAGGSDLRTIGTASSMRIGDGTPAMQAPAVAPDGSIVALVDDGDDVTIADEGPGLRTVQDGFGDGFLRLVRLAETGEELDELAVVPREAFAFDLSPLGDRVALWRRDLRGETGVEVVDLATGRIETAVEAGGVAAAWSPDGARLAILVIEAGGRARWTVWTDSGLTEAASFRPTVTFVRDYLPFWDQYLRASTPWSPDSAALTHAAMGDDGPVVVVQPADGSAASELGAGEMSWWSSPTGRSPSTPVRP